jgi:hypothetical protein
VPCSTATAVRLVTLDYLVAMLSLGLIGGLSLAGLLPARCS